AVDDAVVAVRADHVVPSSRELHRERQADLAQPDDRNLHRGHHLEIRMVSPLAAESRTASAMRTVAIPSSRVTTCPSTSPRTAAAKPRSSVMSGSGLGKAYRITSPSTTPRKAATRSHSNRCDPFLNIVRSAVNVSATRLPWVPVTAVTRSLNGDSQLTRWVTTSPFDNSPTTLTRSSWGRPLRCADRAETDWYAPLVTHAVRSMSWVARSRITPESRIRSGNGPCRRVTTW